MLSHSILQKLQQIEPSAKFSGSPPRIQASTGNIYFVKSGATTEEEQYRGEAESLKEIDTAAPGLAPKLFACDIFDDGRPYFISEYKDSASLSSATAATLGKRLATELHKYKSSNGYGFGVPTYCGATKLHNGWFETWEKCYDSMIADLLQQLRNKGGYSALCTKGDLVRQKVVPKLLGPLTVEPVLLHGDLWNGNAGVDRLTSKPFMFDPASYFGHNEADLSIARMFGGFPESFYTAYHEHFPKADPIDQYSERGDLYELFHYLNHTLLFGGHYSRSAEVKMDKLLSE
ncbi:fructosamine kinase PKL/CAK/FruK [Cyathus striatus]|nr:fructosamine kinase PKL/CAK/FruK [Cyathus striatus]